MNCYTAVRDVCQSCYSCYSRQESNMFPIYAYLMAYMRYMCICINILLICTVSSEAVERSSGVGGVWSSEIQTLCNSSRLLP